jgi:Peptidase family M28
MGFCRVSQLLFLLLLGSLATVVSCKPAQISGDGSHDQPTSSPTPPLPPRRETIWKDFDGEHSLEMAQAILGLGNRIAGSDAVNAVRAYLKKELVNTGWEVAEQHFSELASGGQEIQFCNLVAHLAHVSPAEPRFLLAAHFDSPNLGIAVDPGATDGAANTAILLEIAHTLSLDPRLGAHVELLFLDGHMPFHQLSLSDGLFGSRFYTQMLQIGQKAEAPAAAIVLENLGGSGSPLGFAPNSDPALIDHFRAAAQSLKMDLQAVNRPLLLDHVPFSNANIPSIALLEPDVAYLNSADDNASRLSRDAVAQAGQLVLHFLDEQTNPSEPTPAKTALSGKEAQRRGQTN